MAPDGSNVTYQVDRLEEFRVKAGLTKSELGRLARVSARTIANAEKMGVREETANRIVDAIRQSHLSDNREPPQIPLKKIEKPKKKKKKRKEI